MFDKFKNKVKGNTTDEEIRKRVQGLRESEDLLQRLMKFLATELDLSKRHLPIIRQKTDEELRQMLNTAHSKLALIRAGAIQGPVPVEFIEHFVESIREYLDNPEKALKGRDPDAHEKRVENLWKQTGKPVVVNSEGYVVSSGDSELDQRVGLPGLPQGDYDTIVANELDDVMVSVPAEEYPVEEIIVDRKLHYIHGKKQQEQP